MKEEIRPLETATDVNALLNQMNTRYLEVLEETDHCNHYLKMITKIHSAQFGDVEFIHQDAKQTGYSWCWKENGKVKEEFLVIEYLDTQELILFHRNQTIANEIKIRDFQIIQELVYNYKTKDSLKYTGKTYYGKYRFETEYAPITKESFQDRKLTQGVIRTKPAVQKTKQLVALTSMTY